MKLFVISIVFICLLGCTNRSAFLKLEDFKIHDKSLKNYEPVRVLFVGPNYGNIEDRNYYNQIIVISAHSGDTVNVLISDVDKLNEMNSDEVFYFIDPEHLIKAGMKNLPDSLSKMLDTASQTSYSIGDYKKVMINPRYLSLVKNDYATTFGNVVRDTIKND